MTEIELARQELADAEVRLQAMEEAAAAAPPPPPPEPERLRIECDSSVQEGVCPNPLRVAQAASRLAVMWGGTEAEWADGLLAALSKRRMT